MQSLIRRSIHCRGTVPTVIVPAALIVTVDVTIRGTKDDLVSLVNTGNGTGFAPGATPGIGKDLFTALTFEWSSERSSTGAQITANLTWSPAAIRP